METPALPQTLVVTIDLVMDCKNVNRCSVVEHWLVQRGFQPRKSAQDAGSCKRTFVREHSKGPARRLLDEAIRDLDSMFPAGVNGWSAIVQVSGSESASASLQAGKPHAFGPPPVSI
jgi:hypothetical protein